MNAEMIFTAISTSKADCYEVALEMLMVFYFTDLSIPREEICKASDLLKQHFEKSSAEKVTNTEN